MSTLRKTNVLILDDEPDAREPLKKILERRGYTVFTAENGVEGLKKIKLHLIDIVLCDICMPRMNGLEFLQEARKIDLRVEVIMITGDSSVEHCIEAIEKNACDYLVKPVNFENIIETLLKAAKRINAKKEMLKTAFTASQQKRLAYFS